MHYPQSYSTEGSHGEDIEPDGSDPLTKSRTVVHVVVEVAGRCLFLGPAIMMTVLMGGGIGGRIHSIVAGRKDAHFQRRLQETVVLLLRKTHRRSIEI